MTKLDQSNRILKIKTDLPADQIAVLSIAGEEAINDLFKFTARIHSADVNLAAEKLITSNVTVSIQKDVDDSRFINGAITRITRRELTERSGRYYEIELRPWFWFLTKRSNCRIYQNKNILDIAKEIFSEHGESDFKLDINTPPPKREYITQFNESDYDFLVRLFAEEGINFYFDHENGKHELVISDQNSSYKPAKENELAFHQGTLEEDHITVWNRTEQFVSGQFADDAYDFATPNKPLGLKRKSLVQLTKSGSTEVFEYSGDYTDKKFGESKLKGRLEAEESRFDVVQAQSNCRSLSAGQSFKLARHDDKKELGDYIISSVEIYAEEPSFESRDNAKPSYTNVFHCQPKKVPIRPPQVLPKPGSLGAHRAVVVGPSGEEIYTDKFGRIKVQFKWDRYRQGDDTDSCWLRVNQQWAGNGFGAQFIPRVGTEVIVDFFQGDIDQPYVQGCLYNGENAHPFELPKNKTQSGIKTLTSKSGGGFNALRFEDKKGNEEIYIHGEKDYRKDIKNDVFEKVGRDAERHVVKNQRVQIDKDFEQVVENDVRLTINNNLYEKIAADSRREVKGKKVTYVDGQVSEHYKDKFANETADKYSVKAKSIVLDADTNITLKVGGSEIHISKKEISIKSATIDAKAGLIKLN